MRAPEPISPELALVAPDLAEAARRGLPDRPWEQFAPPPSRPVLRVEPVPESRPAAQPHQLARRRFVTGGRVVTAAAMGFLVISCFLPPRGAPRLVRAPTPQPARAATTPTGTTTFQAPADREPRCTTPTGGSRDPFRPVCPPVTKR